MSTTYMVLLVHTVCFFGFNQHHYLFWNIKAKEVQFQSLIHYPCSFNFRITKQNWSNPKKHTVYSTLYTSCLKLYEKEALGQEEGQYMASFTNIFLEKRRSLIKNLAPQLVQLGYSSSEFWYFDNIFFSPSLARYFSPQFEARQKRNEISRVI